MLITKYILGMSYSKYVKTDKAHMDKEYMKWLIIHIMKFSAERREGL